MLAVEVAVHGGPEALALVEREDPVPRPGEVLIRNEFVGVNFVDLQHTAGRPYPTQVPFIPGTEASGTGSRRMSACASGAPERPAASMPNDRSAPIGTRS